MAGAKQELISTAEAAEIIGVTPARVRAIAGDGTGRLAPVLIGGALVFRRAEVEALKSTTRRAGLRVRPNGKS